MMTRQQVNSQLLAYLNNQLMLAGLVDRAENALVTGGFGPEEDVDLLMDIIMYLAGANSQYFPLTWKVCQDFMRQPGTPDQGGDGLRSLRPSPPWRPDIARQTQTARG